MGKKVYLNPEALQERVDAFKEVAETAKTWVGKIDDASRDQNDPMENPPIETYTPKMREAAIAVDERLAEIEECKKTIEMLSSNGIGTKVGDYGIEIEVPDDKIDSKEKMESWAKAAVDGKDLESLADSDGRGPLPSGRSYDELVKSLQTNGYDGGYANFLIDEVGAENLTKIPISIKERFEDSSGSRYPSDQLRLSSGDDKEMADLLGDVLQTASRTWDRQRSKEVSDAIVESVKGRGDWGRITALNIMMNRPDRSDARGEDVTFGKDFLVSLGDGLEELPWSQIKTYSEIMNSPYGQAASAGRRKIGPALEGESFDPMAGVFQAMSRNPRAAHEYLTPDGSRNPDGSWSPGDEMQSRWDLLTTRPRDSNGGLDAFTAAQAAVSSLRENANADMASSATWVSARSIEYAVDVVGEGEFSDEMKRNLSVVAANCSKEGVNVAQGGSPDGLHLGGNESQDKSTFSTFLYRIMDNKDAATTVSAAFAREVRDKYPKVDDQLTFNNKYDAMGSVFGYLNALGDKRVADMYEDDERRRNEMKEGLSFGLGLGSTAVGGLLTGPVAPVVWSVGSAAVTPAIVDNVVPDALVLDDPISGARSTLQSEAYGEAIARGLFNDPEALNPDLFRGEDGAYPWYSLKDGKPVIDFSDGRGDTRNDQIQNWAIKVKEGGHDPDGVISAVDSAIDQGINKGESLIDGEGGNDSGAITIRR